MALKLLIKGNKITCELPLSIHKKTVGRSSKATIKVDDPLVSGLHISFCINKERQIHFKDLESKNSTYVNGNLLLEGSLFLGDVLAIGSIEITLLQDGMTPNEINFYSREQELKKTSIDFNEQEAINERVRKAKESALKAKGKMDSLPDEERDLENMRPTSLDGILEKEKPTGRTRMIKIQKSSDSKKSKDKKGRKKKRPGSFLDKIKKFLIKTKED